MYHVVRRQINESLFAAFIKVIYLLEGENENMTMNVAGALALVLCLTVTSNQPNRGQVENVLPTPTLSFETETENEITFEKKDVTFVTLDNKEETEAVEAEVAIDETEEVSYENRWNIELTEDEIDLLAKILWLEARGESEEGRQAVIEVVFNRMVSEEFPDTLQEVLSQKSQFSTWKSREKAKPTEKEYATIYSVLNDESSVVREDTVFFARKKITRNLDQKIGGHYFCY